MAVRNLFTRLRQRNGIPATLTRGANSVPVTIRLGEKQQQAGVNAEFSVEVGSRDVFIAAADYAPAGSVVLPQLGDQFAFTLGTNALVFRAFIPSQSDQCFAFCDLEQTELRVHCKAF